VNRDGRLRNFLEGIVRGVVSVPEKASVRAIDGPRATRFEIDVPAECRGQVIGKSGTTIRAIRTLVDVVAERHRRRFEVEIVD